MTVLSRPGLLPKAIQSSGATIPMLQERNSLQTCILEESSGTLEGYRSRRSRADDGSRLERRLAVPG